MLFVYVIIIGILTAWLNSLFKQNANQHRQYQHVDREISRYGREFKKRRQSAPKPTPKRRRKPTRKA